MAADVAVEKISGTSTEDLFVRKPSTSILPTSDLKNGREREEFEVFSGMTPKMSSRKCSGRMKTSRSSYPVDDGKLYCVVSEGLPSFKCHGQCGRPPVGLETPVNPVPREECLTLRTTSSHYSHSTQPLNSPVEPGTDRRPCVSNIECCGFSRGAMTVEGSLHCTSLQSSYYSRVGEDSTLPERRYGGRGHCRMLPSDVKSGLNGTRADIVCGEECQIKRATEDSLVSSQYNICDYIFSHCQMPRRPISLITSLIALILVQTVLFSTCSGLEAASLRDYRFSNKNVTALLDSLLAKNHYDNRIRPDFGGPPVLISVNMHIKSMGPVSETDEMYAMDCYFRQVWYDRRLRFNLSGLTEFSMSWLFLERVWKPDTFFMNGGKSYLHRITVPNKFIRLRNDGFLTYSMRLTIKARCKMHLRKFPLDSQACPLLIGSYGYSSRDVLYQWQGTTSVGLERGVELAQYDLVSISTEGEALEKRGEETYSVIRVFFFLKRHTGYFMLQVYVPCGLIVSCSWVSFWIDPDAVPARVSLGVTTVLSMTTMGFGGRSQMPKVSYATALDWFVILCFSFVFAVMVEYAAINFIDKLRTDVKRKLEEEEKKKKEAEKKEKEGLGGGGDEEDEEERKKRKKMEMGEKGKVTGVGDVGAAEKTPEGFVAGNLVLGGVGQHDMVRVIVETVGDEPVQAGLDKNKKITDVSGTGGRLGGGHAGGVGARAGVGHVVRDNVDWDQEAEEYDEYTDEELDVVGNGAGPEDVVEMAVSDSADRLGVGCDADMSRTTNLRRTRSITASPVDAPKWQQTLLAPMKVLRRSSRLLSREDLGSVMFFLGAQDHQPGANGTAGDAADSSVPAGKFSKIDITSRRMFPLMFFTLITIYWVAYMYYITDEYQAEGWHHTGEDGIGPRRNVVFVAGEENN